jgi:hypothetical protein
MEQTGDASVTSVDQLRAGTDLLSEVQRRHVLLYDAFPTWPIRMRPLRGVLATVLLPIAIAIVRQILAWR